MLFLDWSEAKHYHSQVDCEHDINRKLLEKWVGAHFRRRLLEGRWPSAGEDLSCEPDREPEISKVSLLNRSIGQAHPVEVSDHSAARNQPKAQAYELKNWADELNGKERNKDEKWCLNDMTKALAWTSVFVEGLDDAKKSKYHSWKLNESQTYQDFVRYEKTSAFVWYFWCFVFSRCCSWSLNGRCVLRPLGCLPFLWFYWYFADCKKFAFFSLCCRRRL